MTATWRNFRAFPVLVVLLLFPEAAPAENGVAQIAQSGTPVTARRAIRSSRSPFAARAGSCPTGRRTAEALEAARQAVRSECECFGAASHAAYLRCANRVVDAAIADGRLPNGCRRTILDFAERSACGRRDPVPCCVQQANGSWHALLGRSPRYCESVPGRLACGAHFLHLDDACLPDSGCRESTCGDGIVNRWDGEACEPPGSPGCDPFCQIVYCGNGVVDLPAGEDCEPPGTSTCDDACHFIATCGNGVIEPGEECDGQPGCAHGRTTLGRSACTLLRSVCCDVGGGCIDGKATNEFDEYFNFFKPCTQYLYGESSSGVCEGTEPCPDGLADLGCRVGSCADAPIDPLPLCCQQADGTCRDTIARSSSALAGFSCGSVFIYPEQGDVDRLMLGTCGVDGRCIPAS